MICKILSNYFQSWQIYWQNKEGISSIGTQCIWGIIDMAMEVAWTAILDTKV